MPLEPPVNYDPFEPKRRAKVESELARSNPPADTEDAGYTPSGVLEKAVDYDPFAGLTSSDYFDALEKAQADEESGRRQSRDVGLGQHLAGEFLTGFGGALGSSVRGAGIGLERARLRATDRIEAAARGELTPTRPGAGGIPVLDLTKSVGGLVLSGEEREKLEQSELSRVGDARENFAYKTGEAIDDYLKNLIATNPDLSEQFLAGDVTNAAGSMAGFVVASLFTRGAFARLGASQKAATLAGASGLGAGAGASEAFERALKKNASFEDAYRAANFGAGIGLSEGVPIANLFDRFDKATGGRFKSGIKNALKQGGEEGFQEAFQQVMQNATESKLVAYNPEQGLWEGMGHGAAVGFTTGGLLGFLAGLFGGRKGRRGATDETGDQAEASPEATPGAVGADEAGFLPKEEGELDPEIRAGVGENLRTTFNLQDEAEVDSIIDAAQANEDLTPEQRQKLIDADRPRDTTPVIDSTGFGAIRKDFGKAANDAIAQGETQKTQETQKFEQILEGSQQPGQAERIPENVIDPRLKRANIRNELQRMADSLTIGGDVGVLNFDEANANRPADQEISGERLPSVNPEWFQQMVQDPQHNVSVAQAKNAVVKALAGEKLGVREERVVRNMLETITGERTDPQNIEFAQDQLAAARRLRAALREGVPPTVAEEIPTGEFEDDIINAGQLLDESAYLPEMDGPARSMQEIYEQAEALGLGETVDRINADDTLSDQQKVFSVLNLIEETSSDQKEGGRLPRGEREGGESGGTVPEQVGGAEEIAAGGILQEPEQPQIGETGEGAILEAPSTEVNLPEPVPSPTLEDETPTEEVATPESVTQAQTATQETPAQVKGLPGKVKVPSEPPREIKPAEDNTRAWEKGEKERLVKLIEGYKQLGNKQQVNELQSLLKRERPSKLLKVGRLERGLTEERKIAEEKAEQQESRPDLTPSKPTQLAFGAQNSAEEATGKEGFEIPLPEYVERRFVGGKLLDELTHDELKVAAEHYSFGDQGKRFFPESNTIDDLKAFLRERIDDAIEFNRELKAGFQGKAGSKRKSNLKHRRLVQQALKQGKEVPPEVLAEYPDLEAAEAERIRNLPSEEKRERLEERLKPLKEQIEKDFGVGVNVSVEAEEAQVPSKGEAKVAPEPTVTEEPPEVKTTRPETEPLRLGDRAAWRKVTGKAFYEITLDEYYERRLMGGKLLDDLRDNELKQAAAFHAIEAESENRRIKEADLSRRKGFPRNTDLPLIELPKSNKPNDLFVFLGKVIEEKLGISLDEQVNQRQLHRKSVEKALNEGIKVPKDVLEAYPDLMGKLGKKSDGGVTSPEQPQAEPLSPDGQITSKQLEGLPAVRLARNLARLFKDGGKLTWQVLFQMADASWGGTQAQGTYSVKEAYDAMELGLNLAVLVEDSKQAISMVNEVEAVNSEIAEIKALQNLLPTQTKRDQEQQNLQQFSSPHPHSYVAAWVANITDKDIVLEPSAGTGNLVTYAIKSGAKQIVANEISDRRSVLLKRLVGDFKDYNVHGKVFNENAAHLNAILPKDIKPSVVLMNPPFSADVNLPGKKKTEVGAEHVEQALNRLEEGGRLVAILGKGMARDKATFKPWWSKIEKEYNVRAIIGISGKEYRKFGTSFDNVIVVIDKTGPTRDTVLTGDVEKVEQLPALLEDIRNDRTTPSERASVESTSQAGAGRPGPGAGRPETVQPPTDQADTGPEAGRPGQGAGAGSAIPAGSTGERGGSQSGLQPGATDQSPDGSPSGGEQGGTEVRSAGTGSGESAGTGPDAGVQLESKKPRRTLGQVESAELGERHDLQDSTFENYRAAITIKGAQPHSTPLAESTAMAAVKAPPVKYTLTLPDEVIQKGWLSDVQLESVVRAGDAHETILPNGERQGYFVGDGAGVGKGRTAVGIFLDNWNKGRKKAIWITENQGLFAAAVRDMQGVGMGKDKLFNHGKIKGENKITLDQGVMFTTYDTLKGTSKGEKDAQGQWVKPPKERLTQIVEWVGKDFDGVIFFDESHNMKNATDTVIDGRKDSASARARAGIKLQAMLPKARVVYSSATGFTEVQNTAYANRLGLWGEGTAFANQAQFANKVDAGGVAMMEVVSKDMKAMGLYNARALSYEGVEYSQLQHDLTPEQLEIHNVAAKAWQSVRTGMENSLKDTHAPGKEIGRARGAFNSQMQEFFNATITTMQIPAVIEDVQKKLDAGGQAVLQIFRTGKSIQDRRLAQAERDGLDIGEVVITPADILIQYLQNNFPTTKYQEVPNESGGTSWEPVMDSAGNLVDDPAAVEARDRLILEVAQLRVPESVLDQLINHTWTVDGEQVHGSELIAEVTGRDRRVIRKDGNATIEKFSGRLAELQTGEFQQGKRRILIFSEAGGTGRSYHADKATKNSRKRYHYLIQPGWRADKAVQGLGRSHRTNQYQPPEYILVSTNLQAQKRFLSTIARRLDQLGALTKGSRDTGSQGLFDAMMNLESKYGESALETLLDDVRAGDLESVGLTAQVFTEQMGIYLVDEKGESRRPKVQVRNLLNSMLALDKTTMDVLYDQFISRVVANVEYAKEQGHYDEGMETVRAQSIQKVGDVKVKSSDARRGETRYVKLEFTDPAKFIQWKDIGQFTTLNGQPQAPDFYINRKSGRIYGFVPTVPVTDTKTGRIVDRVVRIGISSVERMNAQGLNDSHYARVKPSGDQIKREWENQIKNAPQTKTTTRHVITGALLPVLDRLPSERPKIIRLATDEGEVLLGRDLPPKKVASTLKNLGLTGDAPKLNPAQFFERVMEHGETLMLSNGWKVLRRRVSNQNRLELSVSGATSGDYDLLRDMGAFTEVIGHNLRVFIPTKDHSVLERILSSKPVTEIITADGSARRGPVEESSVAVDKIETGLTKQLKTLRQNGFPAEVVETVEDLPVQAYADTKGLYWGGRIFLVAENIGSLKEARRVLAHEAVGHAGLEQMLGKEGFDELVNRVISELDIGNSTLTQAAKAVQKTHGELDNDTLAKEILAHLAENGIQNTLLRRVAAKIREWLARLGLGNLPAAEINTLIARAARFTETGPSRDDRGRFITDTPLFSRDNDPADEGAAFANNRLIQSLKKGQPIDRILRGTFSLGLDITEAEGSKRLKNAFNNAAHILNRAELDDDSSFSWVNTIARHVRAGLVDKYGVDERFIERKEEKKAEVRKLNIKAMEFLKNLSEGGVTTRQEWAVIKDVVEGKEIDNERWMKLAAPIRATIDDFGVQAVNLGLLSRESYERLKGVYLHRVYLKHEAQMSGVGNWIAAKMRTRASKIAGNAFKGRGMFDKIEQKRLLRDVDESWWGRRKVEGKADLQLKGQKFIILDDVRQRGEGVDMIEGFEEGGPKPRVVRRVYWPADQAIPDRMADYVNRGTWEVRGTEKGKLILWRDFTKQEREQMGEIVDARYVIAKTFNVLSHDIENAKFFKDIARNKDWTWHEEGPPPSKQIAEPKDPTFWSRTFANAEWVKVPDTTIPKTNGLKAWGELAGKYVRAEIYRDLQEVRLSMQSNWWKRLMEEWKLLKTARNPVVHMNNVMSNMILMDLLDVRWQDLYQGVKHYRAGDDIYKEAFEAGVFGHSFLDQEIKKQYMDPILDELIKESLKLGNGSSNTLMDKIRAMDVMQRVLYRSGKKIYSADQWAQNLYKAEDEVFRMAAYVRRRELGDTPKQAARVAVRQFLDYDISAPWVNNARRTLLPFIAYTYRAAPVIAEAIAARPWKLAKYIILAHIANSLAYMMVPGDEDEERRSLREEEQGWTWMATPRMMRMPYRDRWGNPLFLDIRRWVPAGDFFDVQAKDVLLPNWLQLSGPLAIGFELAYNRDTFVGEDIYDPDLDTTSERLTKLGGHLWRAASTGWAPGGWYWERVGNALRGAEDRSGRQYSLPLALTSSVGIKLKAQDVQAGFESHAFRLDIRLRKLRQELKRAEAQFRQKKISKEAFEEQRDRIKEKVRRHTEQTRKLVRGN